MSPPPLPTDLMHGTAVFVTGGGGGFNLAIAKEFARAGARIALCGRTLKTLESARSELAALGAQVSISVADVRDFAAVEAAIERSVAELEALHTVVCGAAGNFISPSDQISTNGFKAVLDTDLLGSFHTAKAC